MARTSQMVQVGKRKLELSNLDKVLYPNDGITKAEIIQYYLQVAPTLLTHIKGRPLSLVRFPNGIADQSFFQKNRPQWAPEWIDYVRLGSEEKKDYMMATEEASMVWLANLACLEVHQMHSHKPHFDKPDYVVYDLDPPEGYSFEEVITIAFELKRHLENFGYYPFVKTTGGKGLHILTPIESKWDFHTAFETASALAKPFVEKYAKTTTLHIKKEARKGKVLIDIYRNRNSQSIISPYSLRGQAGAPVSMPLTWDQLEGIASSKVFHIKNALEQVLSEGDAWEAMAAYAVPLHNHVKKKATARKMPERPTHKSPEQLKSYKKKRDFEKTPEPVPDLIGGEGHAFVVHRHHASRLHYDLRLEENGALRSWAVPKGLPPRPGIKRLAVQVEDHPIEYLTFEGKIPRGQYGGGDMWCYALGKYETTKTKKTGFYFWLHSPQINAEYRIHRMKEKDWLLERVTPPQVDWLHHPIQPMLAQSRDKPPTSDDYVFEVKWDGIRVMISLDEGELTIRSRSNREITHLFPELAIPEKAIRASAALFDAEIVCLDQEGRPQFKNVISRMHQSTPGGIERAAKKYPVHCYVFDCLYLDGRPLTSEPLTRRRVWLADVIKKDTPFRSSEVLEDGPALFEAAKAMGLEGIIAKRRESKYLVGKRSDNWLKIKVRQTVDSIIIGYTVGNNDRASYFGALHLADFEGEELVYRGKVGSGFDLKTMKEVMKFLEKIPTGDRPVKERPVDNAKTTWLEPQLYCEIVYASITPNKTYREPVFIRLRPDLTF